MNSNLSQSYIKHLKELVQNDQFKEALEYADINEDKLGSEGLYLKGEIYSSAERSLHGITRNMKKAQLFYKQASDLGNSDASYELGMMYYFGDLGKENINDSIFYLKKSVEQGNDLAMFELANLYYDNPKIESSCDAINLYSRLVESDSDFKSDSMQKLGRIFYKGIFDSIPQDSLKAVEYLEQASALGSANAKMDLAYLYFSGTLIKKDLTKALSYAESAGTEHILYDEVIEKITREIRKSNH